MRLLPRSRRAAVVAVACAVSALALPFSIDVGAAQFSDGMPSQATTDLASTVPGNSTSTAGWGDWAAGTASRPYVSALSVINGGVSTALVTGGTIATSEVATAAGAITTVVSPVNLCRSTQTPAAGVCYATPNRVQVTVAYGSSVGGGAGSVGTPPVGYNFAAPSATLSPPVDANSIIDMTVVLGALGSNLRWSWVNGDLLFWQIANPGTANATVHLRFHPAAAPVVAGQSGASGCTATPIISCAVSAATADVLTGSVLFSVDDTLPQSLTGAVFATQHAIFGYLQPGGTQASPTIDIEASSSHYMADGVTLESGVVEALLPASTLLNLYNLLPADAAHALTVTRTGDPGQNGAPTFAVWCTQTCPAGTTGTENTGSDGTFVTVPGISFSVPQYIFASAVPALPVHSSVARGVTTIRATIAACTRAKRCTVSLYDLGKRGSPSYGRTATAVVRNRSLPARRLLLSVRSTRLRKGDQFLISVHSAKPARIVTSTVSIVG
jgi:hypothetical protein